MKCSFLKCLYQYQSLCQYLILSSQIPLALVFIIFSYTAYSCILYFVSLLNSGTKKCTHRVTANLGTKCLKIYHIIKVPALWTTWSDWYLQRLIGVTLLHSSTYNIKFIILGSKNLSFLCLMLIHIVFILA